MTGSCALLWTGAASMLAAAVHWLAASSADPAIRGAQAMARWPLRDWLAVWMPPGVIEPLKASISELLGSMVTATRWIAPMRGWLSPLVWVIWGMVLVLAGGFHVLAARSSRPTA